MSIGRGRSYQSPSSSRNRAMRSWNVGSDSGGGTPRHRRVVVGAGLVDVERGRQVEDGPPVLDGDDAPRRERAAVADAVDLVEDGPVGIARTQELRVQGVHAADVDRAAR